MLLFALAIAYLIVAKGFSLFLTAQPEDSPAKPAAFLKKTGGDWWESGNFIYHGIPAKLVFQMPAQPTATPEEISAAAWQKFDRIGEIFNPFDPVSEISTINAWSASGPIPVSDEIFSVLGLSRRLWTETNGLFDPTLWRLKELWRQAEKSQQIPRETDIAEALKGTGLDHVRMMESPQRAISFVDGPVTFDFGGIVKGYAVDQVREALIHSGICAGLVQLGGEVSAFGGNNGNPWRIGIQHPKEMDKVWGVISSKGDIRVSTSGNYRQPIRISGKSFYHIFSPETGWPVSEKVLGVTTVDLTGAVENARLDGIATAITVMGAENGLALAEKLGIDAVVLYETSVGIGEYVTPGLAGVYEKNPR